MTFGNLEWVTKCPPLKRSFSMWKTWCPHPWILVRCEYGFLTMKLFHDRNLDHHWSVTLHSFWFILIGWQHFSKKVNNKHLPSERWNSTIWEADHVWEISPISAPLTSADQRFFVVGPWGARMSGASVDPEKTHGSPEKMGSGLCQWIKKYTLKRWNAFLFFWLGTNISYLTYPTYPMEGGTSSSPS